jgi:cupin fold WbuC family metalloprotein
MKVFSKYNLDELTQQAGSNSRLRQHWNIHEDYQDPCQRLFNAIEPNSYIRPHCHGSEQGAETILEIRGLMALISFDDQGKVEMVQQFGSEMYSIKSDALVGLVIPSGKWHTVISLKEGSVLLEAKAGPFNLRAPKFPAPWAPEEGSKEASLYLRSLYERAMAG